MLHHYPSPFLRPSHPGLHLHMSLIQRLAPDKQSDQKPHCRETHGDDPYVPNRYPERFANDRLLPAVKLVDRKDISQRIAPRVEVGGRSAQRVNEHVLLSVHLVRDGHRTDDHTNRAGNVAHETKG